MSETQDDVGLEPAPAEAKLINDRVKQYVFIREQLRAKKEAYEKDIAELVEIQNILTGKLQEFMERNGADSIKTSSGTCYNSTRYTASLQDPQAFMDFVIKTNNFDLLDRKANVTAVKSYVEENDNLPPGVNLSAIKTVGVRAPTRKSK